MSDEMMKCVHCGEWFELERDLWLCDDCVPLYDLERLWLQHDKGELCALDFNENKKLRQGYRIKKVRVKK